MQEMALLRDALSVSDGVPLLVVRRRPHRTVIVARKDFAAQPRGLMPEEDRSAPRYPQDECDHSQQK